jgi:hypothetical protein
MRLRIDGPQTITLNLTREQLERPRIPQRALRGVHHPDGQRTCHVTGRHSLLDERFGEHAARGALVARHLEDARACRHFSRGR